MAAPTPSNSGARLPQQPRVAVVGASGLVGQKVLQILVERQFPCGSIASLSSRGEMPALAADADLVFFAGPAEVARQFAPQLVEAGCIVIDLSPAWRLDPQVPLVIPEVNGAQLSQHRGIIASPNCTNVPLVMALAALQSKTKVEQIVVTTMQAASGAGRGGLDALAGGTGPFAQDLADNLIPQCDDFDENGVSAEEQRLVVETQRLLAAPQLQIAATCVRVPVKIGHAMTVYVRTQSDFTAADASTCLAAMPGIKVYPGSEYPSVMDSVGNDLVHIGRLRDGVCANELNLWIVCDNLRKGAATNAVQIAEQLLAL